MTYFKKQLVLGDSLDWFDQIGGYGVSETMPLLNLLKI